MLSMTGYSYLEEIVDNLQIVVEIKSLNHRFLEIYTDLSYVLSPYENEIKKLIGNKVKRGKVVVIISVKEKESDISLNIDLNLAKRYFNAYQQIINELKLKREVELHHLLRQEGIISVENQSDSDQIWNEVAIIMNKVIEQFLVGKKEEGKVTQTNILNILELIDTNLNKVKSLAPTMIQEYNKKVNNRLTEMLSDNRFDEQRIITEIGIIVSKADINEEIERLSSHVNQFRETCLNEDVVGKKLEFISQEMNREINTIGAKANNLEISNLIIDMKNDLEKIKEQIRNVE